MDRIDIRVHAPPVTPADLALPPPPEGTAEAAARVADARRAHAERRQRLGLDARANAQLDGDALERVAIPDEAGRALLSDAATRLGLTARGYVRVLRLARTCADLDGSDAVRRRHVGEAVDLRRAAGALVFGLS